MKRQFVTFMFESVSQLEKKKMYLLRFCMLVSYLMMILLISDGFLCLVFLKLFLRCKS